MNPSLCISNRKLRKSGELSDKMDALSLNEPSSTESKISQLESIFSFPTSDSSSFPQNHCQEFTQQLQHLPHGNTVILLVTKYVSFAFESVETLIYIMKINTKVFKETILVCRYVCMYLICLATAAVLNGVFVRLNQSLFESEQNVNCIYPVLCRCYSVYDVSAWSKTRRDGQKHHTVTSWEGIVPSNCSHLHI